MHPLRLTVTPSSTLGVLPFLLGMSIAIRAPPWEGLAMSDSTTDCGVSLAHALLTLLVEPAAFGGRNRPEVELQNAPARWATTRHTLMQDFVDTEPAYELHG